MSDVQILKWTAMGMRDVGIGEFVRLADYEREKDARLQLETKARQYVEEFSAKVQDELAAVKQDAKRYNIAKTGGIMSDGRPYIVRSIGKDGKVTGSEILLGSDADEAIDQFME